MSDLNLLPADYVLGGLTIVLAMLGLFRGFSGMIAFCLASAAAVFVGTLGWPYSATFTPVVWMRAAGTLIATLLAFGIVRLIVKKLVNGLLAQPSDAIFGALVGAAVGLLVIAGWGMSGLHLEYSYLATQAASILSAT